MAGDELRDKYPENPRWIHRSTADRRVNSIERLKQYERINRERNRKSFKK